LSGAPDMKLKQALTGLLAVLALVVMAFGARAESDYDELSAAIEKNWMVPVGVTNAEDYTVSLRLHVTSEGVVKQIEVLEASDDPGFRTLAESARRAVLITQAELGRLPIPKDKYSPTIIVRWPMKLICEQRGGC
jgi:hypothetical protein